MLRWILIFLVAAIIAAIFGFGKIAGAAVGVAMTLFWLFLAITVVLFLVEVAGGRRPSF